MTDVETILEQFRLLEQEYKYQTENNLDFPVKTTFMVDSGRYMNVLSGRLSTGLVGSKTIYVNEYDGIIDAEIVMNSPGVKHLSRIDASFLTVYRSALTAAFVLHKTGRLDNWIGFIGGGKINHMTALLLNKLGASGFVLIGGRQNVEKNEGCFGKVIGKKLLTGYDNLKKCDTLVVCTNNNKKENLITKKMAPKVSMVIAQDGGYTLAPDWRNDWTAFSDYPKQLVAHFDEEFPYDDRKKDKPIVLPLGLLKKNTYHIGVYLYGTIVADLVTAQYYIENGAWFSSIKKECASTLIGFEK